MSKIADLFDKKLEAILSNENIKLTDLDPRLLDTIRKRITDLSTQHALPGTPQDALLAAGEARAADLRITDSDPNNPFMKETA